MVRFLHRLGANINTLDDSRNTPFIRAFDRGDKKMMQVLHELGADVDAKHWGNGDTSLFRAAKQGDKDMVHFLEGLCGRSNPGV
jgi:ankyrin repeat protein